LVTDRLLQKLLYRTIKLKNIIKQLFQLTKQKILTIYNSKPGPIFGGLTMVEAGGNIVAVSKILGHADLRTTMRYAHPDNSLKETVEKLGNFNSNCSRNCSQDNV
jgi:integrase